jgi:hypothetical protein
VGAEELRMVLRYPEKTLNPKPKTPNPKHETRNAQETLTHE